jgi:hypothetical protein
MALVIVASTAATAGTTATTSGAAASAAGSAGTAIGFGTGLVDIQRTSAEFFAVQGCDGFLGFAGIGHLYEGESARASGVTVRDQTDLIDFAVRFKQGSQFRFGGAVREVANKKLLHGFPFSVSQRKTSDFVGGFGSVSRVGIRVTRFSGKLLPGSSIEPVGSLNRECTRGKIKCDDGSRLKSGLIIPACL